MSGMTLDEARKILDLVIAPEDLIAKVPEFKFNGMKELLSANKLSAAPSLPTKEKLMQAQEQKKTLIFRVARDGAGGEITLAYLKERFGNLIYSNWYLNPPAPFSLRAIQVGWALVDLDPMPGSVEKTYQEQVDYAKEKGARLKSAAADAYDLLVTFKVTGKYYRGTPNNCRTGDVVAKEPVKISDFDKGGMCISTGWGQTVKHVEIGAATELVLS